MPAPHDFIPSRENDLLAWSSNFSARINAPPGPASFGLTALQAAEFAVLHDAFEAGYANATNPNANSKANIIAKNVAKAALKDYARMLARIVRADPGVTMDQRGDLGLTIPDPPGGTPVAAPDHAPELSIVSTVGRVVSVRLRDKAAPTRRGKPPGCAGAVILSYASAPDSEYRSAPPTNPAVWTFQGNATRTLFDVNIAEHVPAGSKVWIIAQWYSTRAEFGPASAPVSTRVGDGVAVLRMAA